MRAVPRIALGHQPGRLTSLIVLSLALAAVALVIGSSAAPTLADSVTFNPRFSTNDTADVVFAANTIMDCSGRTNQCPDARNGIGGEGNLNNDHYSMVYVNVD